MKQTLTALCGIVFALIGSLRGQNESNGRGRQFSDSLLDHLPGDWHVIRRFGSGGKVENTVHVEWVLNHHYPEGKLINRFSFDPLAQTWRSLIRQQEKVEWKLFAEDKFTPIAKSELSRS
jgi:hypothetical protein